MVGIIIDVPRPIRLEDVQVINYIKVEQLYRKICSI